MHGDAERVSGLYHQYRRQRSTCEAVTSPVTIRQDLSQPVAASHSLSTPFPARRPGGQRTTPPPFRPAAACRSRLHRWITNRSRFRRGRSVWGHGRRRGGRRLLQKTANNNRLIGRLSQHPAPATASRERNSPEKRNSATASQRGGTRAAELDQGVLIARHGVHSFRERLHTVAWVRWGKTRHRSIKLACGTLTPRTTAAWRLERRPWAWTQPRRRAQVSAKTN